MKAKKILITGGAGFVGSHLADALLDQGHEVRVFDSLSPQVHGGGIPSYLSPHVELMRGDMRDASACGRAITGIEVIFHLAAAVGVGQSMYHIADYMGANTQGTAVPAIFSSRLLNGRAPLLFEDGRQMRDFVSVHDVVGANLCAMETPRADGHALNIGSGMPISIREVATALTRALGREIPCEITGKYRAGDIRHCFGDISKARKLLGYQPRVNFEDGVVELVGWLGSQSAEDKAENMVA